MEPENLMLAKKTKKKPWIWDLGMTEQFACAMAEISSMHCVHNERNPGIVRPPTNPGLHRYCMLILGQYQRKLPSL